MSTEVTENYRSAVGPPDQYDIIGAMQFCVLIKLGLREHHKLLDIGCGSLCGGRLLIPYLLPYNYYGIEPSCNLVLQGIMNELGQEIIYVKRPQFHYSGDFDLTCFDIEFDYILAQSIFSHASKSQIETCMAEAQRAIVLDGMFVGTYFQGLDYVGSGWRQSPVVTYSREYLIRVFEHYGFQFRHVAYPHPSGRRWFAARRIE